MADATQQEAQKKAAWHQLAERCGATRAAWIKRQVEAQQAPLVATGRTEAWTRAPTHQNPAGLLDGLCVQYVRGLHRQRAGQTHCRHAGCRTPPAGQVPPEDERLPIDAGMQWMVDYDAAENAGMALRIPLTGLPAATEGIGRLIVLGVKTSLDSQCDSGALAGTVACPSATPTICTSLSPGTPTNNTPDIAAGFSSADPGHEQSYQALCSNPYTPGQDPDANGD